TAYISTITPAEVGGLVERLQSYRSRNEWGDPVHHTICDEAATALLSLSARCGEMERALDGLLLRYFSSKQNWEQAAVDAQTKGDYELRDRIMATALQALSDFPIDAARAALSRRATGGE